MKPSRSIGYRERQSDLLTRDINQVIFRLTGLAEPLPKNQPSIDRRFAASWPWDGSSAGSDKISCGALVGEHGNASSDRSEIDRVETIFDCEPSVPGSDAAVD